MEPKPSIRGARAEDHTAVAHLWEQVDALHREHLPWMFKEPGSAASSADFAAALRRRDSALLVAEAGSVVGVARGLMRSAPELQIFVPQRWGVVDSLVVAPAWRRRGVGTLLAKAVEEWAFGEGASWVEVSVYAFNGEARQFYEDLGFSPLRTVARKPRPGAA
jgi:GNAT superfamily N-acetyltransferase